jgi:tyrosyl-tRNA synthetase
MNFIEELRRRDMLFDITPGTEEKLSQGMTAGYIGFDPTAPSLGVGNLVTIMMLVHFQRAGHKPVVLVGGATGMVGDPSGKSSERNLLSEEVLAENLARQRRQLEKFLDFDCGANSATMVNNRDWFQDFGLLEFLRDVGKHITVNYMVAKDSVKSRMETGISFTEFCYQLIQGYDFHYLAQNHACCLQMGGSDQWGNITTGIELIRRMGGGEAFAVTCPLLKKADGTKFGKSESGNVWLDASMTSPYRFYQFWFNASDDDVVKYVKIFSIRTPDEIDQAIAEHLKEPGRRSLQKALAEEVTEMVHGKEALQQAVRASGLLFSKDKEDLEGFTVEELQDVFQGVPSGRIDRDKLEPGLNLVDFLIDTGAFSSKKEARRLIQQGGLRINLQACESPDTVLGPEDILNDTLIWVKQGKRKNHIVYVDTL